MDQQALFTIVAAIMTQLLPQLSSALSPMIAAAAAAEVAKHTARTDALLAELQEERAARLKTPSYPLPLSQPWAPPARPLHVYMSDSQPSAQADPQHSQIRPAAPLVACAPVPPPPPPPQPTQQIVVGHVTGPVAWNASPPPTTSSAPPFPLPVAHPPTALQNAGLQAAQQQALPPHYHQ
jgi:hypothetical protein